MIRVGRNEIDTNALIESYPRDDIKRDIVKALNDSEKTINYDSMDQLKFEIDLRSNTVSAARQLDKSRFSFEVFRKSKANEKYWTRTDEGGFRLNEGVKPSEAIRDIYNHGSKYANECATAMVIVYYKAILDTISEERFNKMFPNIYLMNWYPLDWKLGVESFYSGNDNIPGDTRYFKNPDVDPSTPEWQGENTIYLGKGLYYGHGIGIRNADEVIRALNKRRIRDSTVSAYLLDESNRLGYKLLHKLSTMS